MRWHPFLVKLISIPRNKQSDYPPIFGECVGAVLYPITEQGRVGGGGGGRNKRCCCDTDAGRGRADERARAGSTGEMGGPVGVNGNRF